MQFFRCALLWETLKLSCLRECSMKDDPWHFSHNIEPLQPTKRTNIKVYGKFYYLFCFNLPSKKCIYPTHISISNDAQRSGENQNQDMKYSEWFLSPNYWGCEVFFKELGVIYPDLTTMKYWWSLVKFYPPHCSGDISFPNWGTRKEPGV